jgi:membrane protein
MLAKAARAAWELGRTAVDEWLEDKAARLGAALAFYAVLSLAPFVVIAVGIVGIVYGDAAVGAVQAQFEALVGAQAGRAIAEIVAHGEEPGGGWAATALGATALLLGASGVFGQLQDALNTIWEVEPQQGRGFVAIVRDRFFSFTMVLGTGFLLLVSLLLSAALAAAGAYVESLLPGGAGLWQLANALFSLCVVTSLFALIYRVVPDAEIAWRDVWVGAAVTALLFVAGKFAIGLYLGRSTFASSYGAAGTLLVLLVWIYYTAQILLLGAEFTQVYAARRAGRVAPSPGATRVGDAQRLEQGIPRRGPEESLLSREAGDRGVSPRAGAPGPRAGSGR